MMHCKEIQELLQTDYLDGELNRPTAQFIQEHLRQCSVCSGLEKKLQAQRLLFQGVKPQPVPEGVWQNIRQQITNERLKQKERIGFGILERLRDLIFVRRPAVVLATSLFSVVIIFAFSANFAIQKQILLKKQIIAANIAGYSLSSKNGDVLYDLGTSIEEYFL